MSKASSLGACVNPRLIAILLAGCTLQNSVNDDPERDVPSNAFADRPSERSLALWADPGENLLAAVAEVEALDATSVLPQSNSVLGGILNEAGAYFSALSSYQPFGSSFAAETEQCEDRALPDAVEELCRRIAGREPELDDPEDDGRVRLVIVNDLPHGAFHRVIARELLGCALEAGFGYLAVEALQEDDAVLEARGHVSRAQSGDLTREPQLARLLEEAMGLGYDIVSYDVADRCTTCGYLEAIEQHAEQQAQNLMAKTFDVDPEAQVLVLAGARQAPKRIWGSDEPYTTSLGAHLWALTGHEPYSVEQVAINLPALPFGASSPNPPSGMYLATGPENGQCMGSYTPPSPTGLGILDSVVVHVPPRGDSERWDWLHAPADERQSITLTCAACAPSARLLVQVFRAGTESADRVPVDQALCLAGSSCQLISPSGSYRVVVWGEEARLGDRELNLVGGGAVSIEL